LDGNHACYALLIWSPTLSLAAPGCVAQVCLRLNGHAYFRGPASALLAAQRQCVPALAEGFGPNHTVPLAILFDAGAIMEGWTRPRSALNLSRIDKVALELTFADAPADRPRESHALSVLAVTSQVLMYVGGKYGLKYAS
jgi:hypothetical protein